MNVKQKPYLKCAINTDMILDKVNKTEKEVEVINMKKIRERMEHRKKRKSLKKRRANYCNIYSLDFDH